MNSYCCLPEKTGSKHVLLKEYTGMKAKTETKLDVQKVPWVLKHKSMQYRKQRILKKEQFRHQTYQF
jgi:hypothetical protein